jgi:RNA polymerase sigma-70 factor (ECF subfamily)
VINASATLRVTDDSSLVARLRAGDEQAYETMVRAYSPRMLSVARRMMRCEQDAADALQDAFISAFKSIDSFNESSQLRTWLHRIIVNACLMKLRSQSRHQSVSIEPHLPTFDDTGHHTRHPQDWPDAHQRLESEEVRAQVRACIDRLPDSYRDVILLRDIEQLDTEETAQLLNCTCANVKTRLHRARQALRSLLEPQLSELQSAWN